VGFAEESKKGGALASGANLPLHPFHVNMTGPSLFQASVELDSRSPSDPAIFRQLFLGCGFFARRQLRLGRQGQWFAGGGFSFPLLFFSLLFSEVSLALCKCVVWLYQLATSQ
jgi:hypothetical protein